MYDWQSLLVPETPHVKVLQELAAQASAYLNHTKAANISTTDLGNALIPQGIAGEARKRFFRTLLILAETGLRHHARRSPPREVYRERSDTIMTVQPWLWSAAKPRACPHCGSELPLVD